MIQLERLIEYLQERYYLELIMFLTELTALVIGCIYVRKNRVGQFFIFYIAFDLGIWITGFYLDINQDLSKKSISNFVDYTNTLVAFAELLIYYYFFSKVLSGIRIRNLIKLLTVFYSLLVIIYITTKFSFFTSRIGYLSNLMGVIEFLFLLPPCFVFFYQLITNRSRLKLFERPSFWIITGIFLYSLLSIPFYLVDRYIFINNLDIKKIIGSVFFYVPFTLNFAFLSKAFLCKRTLTT